jgi:hypothetical protein
MKVDFPEFGRPMSAAYPTFLRTSGFMNCEISISVVMDDGSDYVRIYLFSLPAELVS